MFQHVKVAIRRSQERARHRRDYRALLELEDQFLRDIGLDPRRGPRADVERSSDAAAATLPGASPQRPGGAQAKACGCAARAMWSSTPLTNFASLPSG